MQLRCCAGTPRENGLTCISSSWLPIAVAEEIAYENGWITREQLLEAAEKYGKSPYGKHLKDVADDKIIVKPKAA